jgi:hypothetical protein
MHLQCGLWCGLTLIAAVRLAEAGKHYSCPIGHERPFSLPNIIVLIFQVDITYNGGVCDLTNYTNTYWWDGYLVESQAGFDATLGNCTTIIGPIFISPNYTGSFVMNNVANITDNITTYRSVWQNDTTGVQIATDPFTFLTSLQADRLVSLGKLNLMGVPGLDSLSMASLEFVGLLFVFSNPTMSLNFPLLKNSTDIQIQGGYSR